MKNAGLGIRVAIVVGACLSLVGRSAAGAPEPDQGGQEAPAQLVSSAYPPVPSDASSLWLVPDKTARSRVSHAMTSFADGVRLAADAKYGEAMPLVSSRALADTPLADYAAYFNGVILFRQGRLDEAQQAFEQLRTKGPSGFLAEGVRLREAETAEARGDCQTAIRIYEELTAQKTTSPDSVLMSLAKAAQTAGDRERAARAFNRLYYDYPLSDLANVAGSELAQLSDAIRVDPEARFKADMARAQRLFDAKRYAAAQPAFEALVERVSGDDRERIGLRIAECEFYQRHFRDARDGVQPFMDRASRKAEAQFFYFTSIRELGQQDEYVRLARQFVAEFGTSSWVEETLNNLASHYVVNDDDEQADQVFRQLYERFPTGKYAERAAWKIGWWAYKHSRYADTAKVFEQAAGDFPHSDYRPAYLYWSARAREALDDRETADTRYRLVLTDYRNTYYGHLAAGRFAQRGERQPAIEPVAILDSRPSDVRFPPNADIIRLLLALGLNDQALDELQYAQRTSGDSPAITATIAWVRNQGGDLRTGITLMKRAYPQFMAAGGEKLPVDIRRVMYPVDFWTAIKKQAASRKLDPYLVASLILQESSFSPTARSSANAIGLMQLIASTGRRYARSLRIRRFSPVMLTRPDTNLRLGIAYYSDLVKRFGSDHLALASYNAGEHRVALWIAERPGLSREEFIDDIPFPETQNYVKRVLGAAEEYRRLYGESSAAASAQKAPAKDAVKKTSVKKPATPTKKPAKKRS